jgi:hypothetical protein
MRFIKMALFAAAGVLSLGRASSAQKPPPVRLLDRPLATSKREFKAVAAVRHLPNGNLLVNDGGRHQLLMLDSMLNTVSVVADSAPGSTNPYGMSFGGLLPFAGDSTLFVLPRVPSMYMIDPTGAIARVQSVPRPQDAGSLASYSSNGVPGLDAKGRWVYRGQTPPATRPTLVPGGPPGWMIGADSAPVIRYDATTHVLDTITKYKISQLKAKMYPVSERSSRAVIVRNPVETVDAWAVLSDGSVAIVRGQDYHIDFVNEDGSVTRGSKMAYAWERLDDDAKAALIDSLRKADEDSQKKPGPARTLTGTSSAGGGSSATGAGSGTAGTGSSSGGSSFGVSDASGSGSDDRPPPEFPAVNELPDYRPPFAQSAVRPDADGNLWIRTTHHEANAGAVYDVVSRQGKVIDRVQLQPGRSIIAFGRGGIVYLVAGEDEPTSLIERSKWRAP